MRRLLAEVAPISLEWRGPAFRFPANESARRRLADWAVGVLRVEPEDSAVREGVSDAFGDLAGELAQRAPCFAVYEGERLISIAYSAAGVGGPATEVGVDTVSDQRGRGHAARCVSAWALAQIAAGAHPLYSTSWANAASLALARKLGLTLYGENLHWT
jgi:predicted GNAT family acetyltransferase